MQNSLSIYLRNMQLFDYVAYMWLVLIFLIFILLCAALARKNPISAIFVVFFAFSSLVISPYFIKQFLDEKLRKTGVELISAKQLNFTNAIIIELNLTNESKKDFSWCQIRYNFFKKEPQTIKEKIRSIKPLYKLTKNVDIPPKSGETLYLEEFFENISYDSENELLKISTECY